MVEGVAGQVIRPDITGAPQGLVGTLTVAIVNLPSGSAIVAATTAGITESPQSDGTSIYQAVVTIPLGTAPGASYAIEWVTGSVTVTEDLTIDAAPPVGLNLCTLDDVRALMQKKVTDTAQDPLISTLIPRVSVKIMRDYGREFVPGGPDSEAATAATRTFEYSWGDQYPGEAFVSLAPYDLKVSSAITVQVDTDQSAPITLTTDEYRTWPQPPQSGVYMALKVLPLNVSVGIIGWRKRQIKVTGDWGFPSIPPEVTQACAETVVYWITANPATHRFAGSPDTGVPPVQPRGYPMAALDLLSAFKRMTV